MLALLGPYRANGWLWASLPFAAWHMLEHLVIIAAYLSTGVVGTPGLLSRGGALAGGLPLSRPDLHFLYNLIETTPLVVAFLHQTRQVARQRSWRPARAS